MLIIAILFLDKRRSCANLVLQRLDFTSFICVNITGSGSIISGGKAVEDASEDVTDATPCSSSSFGDTDSGLEDASASAFTNTEVESPMCDGDQSKTSLCRYVSDSVSVLLVVSVEGNKT